MLLVLAAFTASLLIEIFAFNFQHWQTLRLEEVTLKNPSVNEQLGTLEAASFSYSPGSAFQQPDQASTEKKFSTTEYKLDNVVANSLKVVINDSGSWQNKSVLLCIDVSDSGNSQGTYRLDDLVFSDNTTTATEKIQLYGYLKDLKISAQDSLGNSVQINEVVLNTTVPINFQYRRVLLLLAAFAFIYAFRPSSLLWRKKHSR